MQHEFLQCRVKQNIKKLFVLLTMTAVNCLRVSYSTNEHGQSTISQFYNYEHALCVQELELLNKILCIEEGRFILAAELYVTNL